jgi:S-formylglutathione hydrolase FrmB
MSGSIDSLMQKFSAFLMDAPVCQGIDLFFPAGIAVRMRRAAFVSVLCLLSGCQAFAFLFPAPVPMQVLQYPASPDRRARCLVILLPGRGDDPEVFEKEGFVKELRSRGLDADAEVAGATFGYYARWTFPERFGTDVAEPAVLRGYEHIWLAGASMGGFGAADFATHHADQLDGVFLIAPYLGEHEVQEEIERSGGLRSWTPREATGKRDERALWLWLKDRAAAQDDRPGLYLGFGNDDGMHDTHSLLAAAMPPAHVYAEPGGHGWPAWRLAWAAFLTSSDFASRCGPAR